PLKSLGWSTSMPRAVARRFTGPGSERKPRPAGRSGCVSARTTSWPASRRRASARSANSGVPAKTRRRKAQSGALAQLLGKLGADALLLELRQVLDEDLALQMIHFMLDAHGEQALRLQRECSAVLVVGAHLHALCPLHQFVDGGHRETAFLDIGHPDGFHDLG